MGLTVCFDALGTCFTVEVLIDAVEELLGDRLREAGSDARMTVQDWVGSSLSVTCDIRLKDDGFQCLVSFGSEGLRRGSTWSR